MGESGLSQTKAKKVTYPSGSSSASYEEWYIQDASGNEITSYKKMSTDNNAIQQTVILYASSKVGYYKVPQNSTATTLDPANLRFELCDHLSSVRAVVTGVKDNNGNAQIVALTDYYAFGAVCRKYVSESEAQQYGFDGMKRDVEEGDEDYTTEFRQFDADLGRWMSPDPLMDMFADLSPYNFCENNPVNMTDVMGLAPSGVIPPDDSKHCYSCEANESGESTSEGGSSGGSRGMSAGQIYGAAGAVAANVVNQINEQRAKIGQIVATQEAHLNVMANETQKMASDDPWKKFLKRFYRKNSAKVVARGEAYEVIIYANKNGKGKTKYATFWNQLRNRITKTDWFYKRCPKMYKNMISRRLQTRGAIKGGGNRNASGYANKGRLNKHLDKRNKQNYNFRNTDEMETYGDDFFKRAGDDIIEFKDKDGYIHRIDNKTQEYGVLQPDGKVQSVFKVEPSPDTKYRNAMEYLENQMDDFGVFGK